VARVPRASERVLLGLVLGCAFLAGCERLRDVKRCRELADRVNTKLDAVDREVARGNKDMDYGKISKEYAALAKSIAGFDGGTPELVHAVSELEVLARNASRHAHLVDQMLEGDNPSAASVSKRELERLARQEKSIAARIDDECRPR
jgi:hypothetical protein